jgi:phospholipase/carboxylesterase
VTVLTRRRFLLAAGRMAGVGLVAGCGIRLPDDLLENQVSGVAALLTARPGAPPDEPPHEVSTAPGTRPLALVATRDTLLHVPPAFASAQAVPVVVTLHGAGGDAESGLGLLRPLADERGLLLLAPASRGSTWDAIRDGYGPDVELIDRALEAVFASFPVDARRVAFMGFSDGASYALGLGLANGGLCRRIVAFSPGFVPPGPANGKPLVFVSHGVADDVLPISQTSRKIVPDLRNDGYDVTYREFRGPHTVPPEVAQKAVDWLGWT